MSDSKQPRVVIIGGGFGGLSMAMELKRKAVEVVLIDRRNYHLFQPLLYQVATAGLSPADIAAPIRGVLSSYRNTRVMLGNATRIDREKRHVTLESGGIDYDYLVIAAGMQNNYFGNDDWEEHAPGLKTLEEAVDIRRRMLLAFEAAEYEQDPEKVKSLLTFVVIGGGPTGVEMAGAIAEVAQEVMLRDFRNVDPSKTRIVLVEGQERLLPGMAEISSQRAKKALEKRGVEVILNTFVTDITKRGVTAGDTFIPANNALWGAGLKGASVLGTLDTEVDRAGRVIVEPGLSIPGDERVYVIGDAAHFDHDDHGLLPGLAPVAMQQGKHAARNVLRHMRGQPLLPFEYFDKGSMATIGRHAAVAEAGSIKLGGFIAWLAWLFIHLIFLVGFRNKVSVLVNWVYSYIAFRRSTRLIVGIQDTYLGRKILAEAPKDLEGPGRLFEKSDAFEDVGQLEVSSEE